MQYSALLPHGLGVGHRGREVAVPVDSAVEPRPLVVAVARAVGAGGDVVVVVGLRVAIEILVVCERGVPGGQVGEVVEAAEVVEVVKVVDVVYVVVVVIAVVRMTLSTTLNRIPPVLLPRRVYFKQFCSELSCILSGKVMLIIGLQGFFKI